MESKHNDESATLPRLCGLYLVNAALLLTHQIDQAGRTPWLALRLPGGRAASIVIDFTMILLVLYGLMANIRRKGHSRVFCWLLVAGSLSAAYVRALALLSRQVYPAATASLILTIGLLVVSIAQATVLVRTEARE